MCVEEYSSAGSIETRLDQHESKDMLRFLTCGSVDDGKSTLMGRLLFDTKVLHEDQLVPDRTTDKIDLAQLVDGLESEREQGITIDVAYRYFSTQHRKFIMADAPGHEQYTRNMITAASTADAAVVLVDAYKGMRPQTRRHSIVADLLGICRVVVAVNKMDVVGFSQEVFDNICAEYRSMAGKLGFLDIIFVPVSALEGDNVVWPSTRMPWYSGKTLIRILEALPNEQDGHTGEFRFPVQYVNRHGRDFRGYSGTVASGRVRKGDTVTVLPSGLRSRIADIVSYEGSLDEAVAPMAVTLLLQDDIDVGRGDLFVHVNAPCRVTQSCTAHLIWMAGEALRLRHRYLMKLCVRDVPVRIPYIECRIDINTQEEIPESTLTLNEIGRCYLELEVPVAMDSYWKSRQTGSFILIDLVSNATVAAGMVIDTHAGESRRTVDYVAFEKELETLVQKYFPH